MTNTNDQAKPFSPACERNQEPILEVLKEYIDKDKATKLFEMGSGTGQHAVFFAKYFSNLEWTLSDVRENHLGIQAWTKDITNTKGPLAYEVGKDALPFDDFDYYFTANTLHIMPWNLVQKALQTISLRMKKGSYFFIYGPFKYNGKFTSDSNEAFDVSLKEKNSEQGIRDFEEISETLVRQRVKLVKDHAMPANNQLLVFKKDQ